ncbi:MAG: hypothetical protein IJA02_08840 [Clostridia bacterium]|nr:hypothetical protein [Clostridia bacterium]MBR6619378.1 hypothetical protein [Clostridia bacterium]
MFKKAKKKIRFYKLVLFEVLETLVTICMHFNDIEQHHYHRNYPPHMIMHARSLKALSKELRKDLYEDEGKESDRFI